VNNIPVWPISNEEEQIAVNKVLASGLWWRNVGTEVKAFEKEFADYNNCTGCVSVCNGTVAIEIALKILGISEGDEVIVPDMTFYSTVSAVLICKAVPVMVDVSPETFCIDINEIKKNVTNKTKAIIVVHMAGNVCDMDEICAFAKEKNIYVIEDAAHAHGALYKGKKAGSLADCSTFSFQNAKLLTSGEGGAVLCNNKELLNKMFLYSNCGRAENDTTYQHIMTATNARLSELQGAVLRVQLRRLNEQHKLRCRNYKLLSEMFKDIPGIKMQYINDSVESSHYMVMFYYDKCHFNNKSREEFVAYLKNNGISCNRAFEAIHRLPVFSSLDSSKWKVCKDSADKKMNSEIIAENAVGLNHSVLLGNDEYLQFIVKTIKEFK